MTQAMFDLNRHGVLKAPVSLWLCAAFLMRQWALLLLLASSWTGPAGNTSWVYGVLSWPLLAIESPMLLLVIAGLRRVPAGGAWARILWHRGREIMSITAAVSVGWALWYLSGQEYWNPLPERLAAAMAVADAAILVGVWRVPLYRAVFEDFPVIGLTKAAKR